MSSFVVIHTTPATVATIPALIREQIGPCHVTNLLDDSVLPEINQLGGITPRVRSSLYALLQIAQAQKPDAILCACSSIGAVMEEGAEFCSVPVLRIDGPMAETAVRAHEHIAVLATVESTLVPTTELIRRKAEAQGKAVALTAHVEEGAGALLQSGNTEEYDALVAQAVARQLQSSEVVLLAQASMACCLDRLPQALRKRVYSSPESGVAQLRRFA